MKEENSVKKTDKTARREGVVPRSEKLSLQKVSQVSHNYKNSTDKFSPREEYRNIITNDGGLRNDRKVKNNSSRNDVGLVGGNTEEGKPVSVTSFKRNVFKA